MTRVCHMSSAHRGLDVRIYAKECVSLANAGYETHLVIQATNDQILEAKSQNVIIHPLPTTVGRFDRIFFQPWRTWRSAIKVGADIYHFHDPELILYGIIFCILGKKIIYDAHENTPVDILSKEWIPRFLRYSSAKFISWLECFFVKRGGWVVTVAEQIAERFRGALIKRSENVPGFERRVAVVENHPILNSFPEKNVSFSSARIFHAGALTSARGLVAMVKLARLLGDRGELVLAGVLEDGFSETSLDPAKYLGVLNQAELIKEYGRSNIGIILYQDVGQYGMATAIKLYEYMAASMPIIVPDHGDWPKFVNKIGCGIAVDVDDPLNQLRAINSLISNPVRAAEMGRRGRAYVMNNASWDSAFNRLRDLYVAIAE